jgi:Transmembrane secretion effector
VDRINRKRMMLLTDVGRGAVIVVLPVLALTGGLHVYAIYIVAFVVSTLGILFQCGEFAAIPSLVGRDDLVAANARIMATNNAGQVLGPILAGVLVSVMSPANLLFFDAGSFLVSAGTLAFIRRSFNADIPNPRVSGSGVGGLLGDVKEGLNYVWSNPVLRTISIMMALINLVCAPQSSQLVLFAKRTLRANNSEVAYLFAAGALGIVVVSLCAAAIRRHLSFAVTALGALVISGLFLHGHGSHRLLRSSTGPVAASSGFGLLLNINTSSLRQAIVPSHMYGRVISIATVLAWSAIPVGALAGAGLIKLTGNVAYVYAASGALSAVIAALFFFSPIRHGDRYLAKAAAEDEQKEKLDLMEEPRGGLTPPL